MAILGISIKSEKFSAGRRSMWVYIPGVSNGSIFGPLLLYEVEDNPELACSVLVFAYQFPWLSPPILIREFRAWYVNYAVLHGASFSSLRFSISSKLSKSLWKCSDFSPKNQVFAASLAKFWRYRKSDTTKWCAMQCCIIHLPSCKFSDQHWWTQLGSSHRKSSIVDVVRPLPQRPIKLADSKYGIVAGTTHSQPACCWLENVKLRNCYRLERVAFLTGVESAL